MARQLKEAVVLITGASAGIGKAAALAFAKQGAKLLLAARRRDQLEEVAAAVRSLGGEAIVAETDVADRQQVQSAVNTAISAFGRLDFLVNNAGIGYFGLLEDTPIEAIEALWAVNMMGTIYATQAAIPLMRKQRGGHIINIASVAGKRGAPGNSIYCATKFAMVGLSEALRVELHGSGIEVSLICPITTSTEFFEASSARSKRFHPPTGPMQTAEKVARAIIRCARRPRPEVIVFPPARILVLLNVLSPRLADRIFLGLRRRLFRGLDDR
ncbi:MAG: SDR family oxidoreductase [candidate division NC10 bacterium]|nr:SDR family oxidoreductase [candidate division NC10 bacterium]